MTSSSSSSQTSLLLVALLLPLIASTSAQPPTIYEILKQHGFPPGLVPDAVETYSISNEGPNVNFWIKLNNPCQVKYDKVDARFEGFLSGFIGDGIISQLKGLEFKVFGDWTEVEFIKVEDTSLEYWVSDVAAPLRLDIDQFSSIPTCNPLAASHPSSKLISQVPLTAA